MCLNQYCLNQYLLQNVFRLTMLTFYHYIYYFNIKPKCISSDIILLDHSFSSTNIAIIMKQI